MKKFLKSLTHSTGSRSTLSTSTSLGIARRMVSERRPSTHYVRSRPEPLSGIEGRSESNHKYKRVEGLTLIEVLVASSILVFCLTTVLASFIAMFFLSDLSRDITRAKNAVQAQMEEMKEKSFDSLSTYNGTTFDIAGFALGNAKGRIEVRDVTGHPDLKEVRVLASFRVKNRIIGEDTNFNGVLDAGEDANANNRLDSPVEVVTLITK